MRSVSWSSQCKTVTSSGEMILHKASLMMVQLWSWKVFTHLVACSVDMIISHHVWAQFACLLPASVHFYFLTRHAGGLAGLELYAVYRSIVEKATNWSKEEEKTHFANESFLLLLVQSSVCRLIEAEQSTLSNANTFNASDFPLQHLSCSTTGTSSTHFLVFAPHLLPTPASKTALTSLTRHAARARGAWSEHSKRTFGVK